MLGKDVDSMDKTNLSKPHIAQIYIPQFRRNRFLKSFKLWLSEGSRVNIISKVSAMTNIALLL